MQKILFIVTLLLAFLTQVGGVEARVNIAGASAKIHTIVQPSAPVSVARSTSGDDYVTKRHAIRSVLSSYGSPMEGEVDAFMRASIKYDIDCYLLPSIAGLESTFGRFIWPESYNAFGWGGGYIMFEDWETGIDTVAKGLRKGYVSQGHITPQMIGSKYSESPTWAVRVNIFIGQFERAESSNALQSVNIALQ